MRRKTITLDLNDRQFQRVARYAAAHNITIQDAIAAIAERYHAPVPRAVRSKRAHSAAHRI